MKPLPDKTKPRPSIGCAALSFLCGLLFPTAEPGRLAILVGSSDFDRGIGGGREVDTDC